MRTNAEILTLRSLELRWCFSYLELGSYNMPNVNGNRVDGSIDFGDNGIQCCLTCL